MFNEINTLTNKNINVKIIFWNLNLFFIERKTKLIRIITTKKIEGEALKIFRSTTFEKRSTIKKKRLSSTLFSINNMFEIELDTGAKKIKNIPIAMIAPVKGNNISPAKKPAKEYLLKKKRDKGKEIKEAERFALNNSLKYLWNFEKNFKKISLPITIEAVNT